MKTITRRLWLLAGVLLLAAPGFAQTKNDKALTGYQTIVVEKATVEDNPKTKEFPGGHEVVMQKSIVANLLEKKTFAKVIDGAEASAPAPAGKAVTLVTQVIEFDKGNRAARWAVGFGAGATKVKVRFTLKDAASGQELLKVERQGKFYGTIAFVGGGKDHAVSEAAGDVVDGLIKEISKAR